MVTIMILDKELVRKHIGRLIEAKTTVKQHTKRSKLGKTFTVKQHDRDVMNMAQFQKAYPKVQHVLAVVADDNNMEFNTRFKLDQKLMRDLPTFERDLKKVPRSALETLAMGEHTDQQKIIKKYGLRSFNNFLVQAFDGKYSETFYK